MLNQSEKSGLRKANWFRTLFLLAFTLLHMGITTWALLQSNVPNAMRGDFTGYPNEQWIESLTQLTTWPVSLLAFFLHERRNYMFPVSVLISLFFLNSMIRAIFLWCILASLKGMFSLIYRNFRRNKHSLSSLLLSSFLALGLASQLAFAQDAKPKPVTPPIPHDDLDRYFDIHSRSSVDLDED